MNLMAILVALLAPIPCQTWELQDDASLVCDGTTIQEGQYVLHHDKDDGDIMGASAWRQECDELCADRGVHYLMSWDLPDHLRVSK